MDLTSAIVKILNTNSQILFDISFVSSLINMGAFDQHQEAIAVMMKMAMTTELYLIVDNPDREYSDMIDKYVYEESYDEKVINYIFDSIRYAKLETTNYHYSNHFQFKGIEISGNVFSFVEKLENLGFVRINEENANTEGNVCLYGNFAGFDNCLIMVSFTSLYKEVYSVCVVFPTQNIWSSIKSDYLDLKNGLSRKYGEPDSFEMFNSPYYEGDGEEDTALKTGNCVYFSKFDIFNGEILLNISKTMSIFLIYNDKKNKEMMENEKRYCIEDDL